MQAKSFRFNESDLNKIGRLKTKLGLNSDIEIIRFCLTVVLVGDGVIELAKTDYGVHGPIKEVIGTVLDKPVLQKAIPKSGLTTKEQDKKALANWH